MRAPDSDSDSGSDENAQLAAMRNRSRSYLPRPPEGAKTRAAQATKAVFKLTAGGLFGFGSSAKDRAKAFAQELATLRGVYTKVGQVVAAFLTATAPAPDTLNYHLAEELAALQHLVLPMEPSGLLAEMSRTWGRDVLEVLEEPPEILAAASIGQVFRGRLKRDGRAVAIKVQYPGIARAMEDDLCAIEGLLGLVTKFWTFKASTKAIATEVRTLIGGEIDYALETRVQRAFHDFWKGHPSISVPEPIEDLCGPTVIVQELARGVPFSQFVAKNADNPDARLRAAVNLFEFFNESLVVLGLFHADPHPGNVLVRSDGGVTMLDYGCVRSSPVASRDLSRRTLMYALANQRRELTEEFAAHPAFAGQPPEVVQTTLDILWPVFVVHAEPFGGRPSDEEDGKSVFSVDWLHRCHGSMAPTKMSEVLGPPDMLFKHRLTHGLNCMLVELSPPGSPALWRQIVSRYSAADAVVPPTQLAPPCIRVYQPPHAVIRPGDSEEDAFGHDIRVRYVQGQALRARIGPMFSDAAV